MPAISVIRFFAGGHWLLPRELAAIGFSSMGGQTREVKSWRSRLRRQRWRRFQRRRLIAIRLIARSARRMVRQGDLKLRAVAVAMNNVKAPAKPADQIGDDFKPQPVPSGWRAPAICGIKRDPRPSPGRPGPLSLMRIMQARSSLAARIRICRRVSWPFMACSACWAFGNIRNLLMINL